MLSDMQEWENTRYRMVLNVDDKMAGDVCVVIQDITLGQEGWSTGCSLWAKFTPNDFSFWRSPRNPQIGGKSELDPCL